MGPTAQTYQADPEARPDAEFEPGSLRHLVPGNTGRMLDTRRTPIAVRSVDPDLGTFDLEVLAFEDKGARWVIEAERISSFQFPASAASAEPAVVRALAASCDRFDRRLDIPIDRMARARTRATLREEERRAAEALGDGWRLDLATRVGDAAAEDALQTYLRQRGLDAIEAAFAARYASNATSGELVKGHEIVLAQLGLVPYHGKVVRDPHLFTGPWTEASRAEHLLARLGFVRALFRSAGHDWVWLCRGIAAEAPLRPPSRRTFVSSTFDPEVAQAVAARSPATVVTVVTGQRVSVDRLFMTFVETAELNGVYHEAEAVLLAEPRNRAF